MNLKDTRIAVIGLGYVGLPLAVEFAKKFPVIGYDIKKSRIAELREGRDSTREVEAAELATAHRLSFTDDPANLDEANVFIVTAPTPINKNNQPDLGPLLAASKTVGQHLSEGDVVIFESTVYPGATEDDCVPVLERESGLKYNEGFFVGYSPERINPGDKVHRFSTIVKVTSGSTTAAADFVDALYSAVVKAGTYKARSIRVAEAAKVIENTQRDVNIALINELAILFNRLDLDTEAVLDAASSKWNFLPFRPGLVGGHCIGVDPYYLTHKAQAVGYHPEIILAGRRLNDSMGSHVSSQLVKAMSRRGIRILDARVLILGLTFKENTPDIRNTRVVDIISDLSSYGVRAEVHDPLADPATARRDCGVTLIDEPSRGYYDAIILAVAHREFVELGAEEIRKFGKEGCSILYDLKCVLSRDSVDLRL
ncbi:nucleotide sugar dehydrogenase [Flaviflexus salsibiostraticola]|uniref:Nucleotide sugar dehydrogenase n=1 Tax=Flaviflexus salsibiostraticola TaxID=1282737 RepID=A0A3Q8WSI8_9ACTO|nr:nucleotide sugar dehydrogenase [Flaviflexus salsibiostraticola]AZN29227.1 nucleotide sugar dehydrogenase [Flaviflexus salsibiostraticola]